MRCSITEQPKLINDMEEALSSSRFNLECLITTFGKMDFMKPYVLASYTLVNFFFN